MSKVWKVSKVWEMSKVWEVSSINENSQTFIKFWHFLKLIASKTLFKKSYRNVNQCSVFTFHVPRLVNIIHDFNFKDFQSPGYTHLNEWWQSYWQPTTTHKILWEFAFKQFMFITTEMELDSNHQNLNVRYASRVAKQLNT